jgi:hypothetical protein
MEIIDWAARKREEASEASEKTQAAREGAYS